MMISVPTPDRQPCLFEALPASEPRNRPGRRPAKARPAAPASNAVAESPPAVAPPPAPIFAPAEAPILRGFAEPPPRLDPAALTHPDLSDLVGALGTSSLAFLLVQAVREARRRLEPDIGPDICEDDEDGAGHCPDPLLVRSLRTVLLELTESE